MFFSEVEGHMQKLSSFGRGKKFALKCHLVVLPRSPSIIQGMSITQGRTENIYSFDNMVNCNKTCLIYM